MKTAGLFAGVGGIEEGLRQAGFEPELLCEVDDAARAVLARRFPEAKFTTDIRHLNRIPRVDLLTAGFPCQDLSQVGGTRGINGKKSGLVREVFRLLAHRGNRPKWVLLENVPFMLRLQRGRAMHVITNALEELGYAWAYRVVDSRAFGLPHRRKRVLILASRSEDPRDVLLADDVGEPDGTRDGASAFGFYWTEGNRGLGWAVEAVPALKTGSGNGIPSPPAIWLRSERRIVVPDIRDAERLQGFVANWTNPLPSEHKHIVRHRWRQVGNAVSVPVARWVGQRLREPRVRDTSLDRPISRNEGWGLAGWGHKGKRYETKLSDWPVRRRYHSLSEFLKFPVVSLSARATEGFLQRALASNLRFAPGFLTDVAHHLKRMKVLKA